MIHRVRQTLLLIVLGIRDLLASAGPVVLLAAGVLVAAFWWLDPLPPRQLTLATGPAGSAYAEFGAQYARALAREGVRVNALTTEGSLANLQALRSGAADIAFVRGGSADVAADSEAGISSLGALFYEPLWIFYRHDAKPAGAPRSAASASTIRAAAAHPTASPEAATPWTQLEQLKGLRVSLDQPGSGVPDVMRRLLEASGMPPGALTLQDLAPETATEALLAGRVDAIVLASAPESPLVQKLLRAPGIGLMELAHADALTRRFPFLQTVTLPRGVADLAGDVPPRDVTLLAATTSLLTREAAHPALRQLMAQAAQGIHGGAGWFNRARDFPNTRTSELPVSPEGDRAINGTPPFWRRYLPFWASSLLERMWLVIGGLIVLLLPMSRVVPPLYTFRVRRRVFRWYARLRDIDARAARNAAPRNELLNELDELDRVANQIAVPLAHADELYALRNNIDAVRRRLVAPADHEQGNRPEVGATS